jgi:hypothetical protein
VDEGSNLRDLISPLMAFFRIGNILSSYLTFRKTPAIIGAGAERPREAWKKVQTGRGILSRDMVRNCPSRRFWQGQVLTQRLNRNSTIDHLIEKRLSPRKV